MDSNQGGKLQGDRISKLAKLDSVRKHKMADMAAFLKIYRERHVLNGMTN